MPDALVALYGWTYWDAEVEVDLASLATGKGKVDARVNVVQAGFALNAARALGPSFPAGTVRVVTVTSWDEGRRLERALPPSAVLDAIVTDDLAPPAVSVIINPRRECRILRDRREDDAGRWRLDRVPEGALSAHLHVLGRLPGPFVAGLVARVRGQGSRSAWVGGHGLTEELERDLDLMVVNTREAERLLGRSGAPRDLAEALVARASATQAVRVVTGAGRAPMAAVSREAGTVRYEESAPPAIDPEAIVTLKGVGDAFAAHFLAAACFDEARRPRLRLEVGQALAAGHAAAARFLAGSPP